MLSIFARVKVIQRPPMHFFFTHGQQYQALVYPMLFAWTIHCWDKGVDGYVKCYGADSVTVVILGLYNYCNITLSHVS